MGQGGPVSDEDRRMSRPSRSGKDPGSCNIRAEARCPPDRVQREERGRGTRRARFGRAASYVAAVQKWEGSRGGEHTGRSTLPARTGAGEGARAWDEAGPFRTGSVVCRGRPEAERIQAAATYVLQCCLPKQVQGGGARVCGGAQARIRIWAGIHLTVVLSYYRLGWIPLGL